MMSTNVYSGRVWGGSYCHASYMHVTVEIGFTVTVVVESSFTCGMYVSNTCLYVTLLCSIIYWNVHYLASLCIPISVVMKAGWRVSSYSCMHSCPTFLLQTLSNLEFSMKKVGQECVNRRNRVILVLGLLSKAQVGEALQVTSPRDTT